MTKKKNKGFILTSILVLLVVIIAALLIFVFVKPSGLGGINEASAKETKYSLIEDGDYFKKTGRTSQGKTGENIYWSYSGIAFSGKFGGEITLEASAILAPYLYHNIAVVVDGDYGNPDKYAIYNGPTSEIVLRELPFGEHTVEIFKLNEAQWGYITIESVTVKGKLGKKPKDKEIQLEFIGDSITCGLGIYPSGETGTFPVIAGREIEEEDSFYTYAALTSRALNADASFVSLSGWGVITGSTDKTAVVPNLYDKICGYNDFAKEEWNFSKNQVDAVIINLGTNDGSAQVTDAAMKEGVRAFLTTIREKYPDSQIIWCYGMMFTPLDKVISEAVASMNDPAMHYILMPTNTSGGLAHPEYAGHKDAANVLITKLRELGVK